MIAGMVTVIVPSYNHARFLRECLDSVLQQDYPSLEVIVVDDGSQDSSRQIIESYGNRICALYQQGGRQARARNMALKVARGEYVAFLDSDDRYLPGRLRTGVQALERDPTAGVAWCDYGLVDETGQALSEVRWSPRHPDFRRELIAGNPICNAAVTVRRSVLDAIGGFDERIPRACDGAAWYQIAARGFGFVHVDGVHVEYRLHGANDSRRFATMTRERDLALTSAAGAYIDKGLVSGARDLRWLRDALTRQFAFGAAASVQQRLPGGPAGWLRARAYALLGSSAGLEALAGLRSIKHLLQRREGPA